MPTLMIMGWYDSLNGLQTDAHSRDENKEPISNRQDRQYQIKTYYQ